MLEIIFGIAVALVALFFLGIGVVALVGGAVQKKRCSASVEGTVSAVHREVRKNGKNQTTVYIPEFQYRDGKRTRTMRSNFATMTPKFQRGQSVTIHYDPADPTYAYVAEDKDNSGQGSIVCIVIGVLLAIGAVVLFA